MKRIIASITLAIFALVFKPAEAQKFLKNEISTAPLSFLTRNVQLAYERLVDTTGLTNVYGGVRARYYYSAPASTYDSIEHNGGDITFFAKFKTAKRLNGFYVSLGAMAGYYNIAAAYGYETEGFLGFPANEITSVSPQSFFTFGAQGHIGYKVLISRFSLDISGGYKFLALPSNVKTSSSGDELQEAWVGSPWTDFESPGCNFSFLIHTGIRF